MRKRLPSFRSLLLYANAFVNKKTWWKIACKKFDVAEQSWKKCILRWMKKVNIVVNDFPWIKSIASGQNVIAITDHIFRATPLTGYIWSDFRLLNNYITCELSSSDNPGIISFWTTIMRMANDFSSLIVQVISGRSSVPLFAPFRIRTCNMKLVIFLAIEFVNSFGRMRNSRIGPRNGPYHLVTWKTFYIDLF